MTRHPDYDAIIVNHLRNLAAGGALISNSFGSAYGVCAQMVYALLVQTHGVTEVYVLPYNSVEKEQAERVKGYAQNLASAALKGLGYTETRDPLGDFDEWPANGRWEGERGRRRRELAGAVAAWIAKTSPAATTREEFK